MTVSVLFLFLAVSWVGLQCVIVVFAGHTHFLFSSADFFSKINCFKRYFRNTIRVSRFGLTFAASKERVKVVPDICGKIT